MELFEFMTDFPEFYSVLLEDVRFTIEENGMNGEESLRQCENMIDNIVRYYEQEDMGQEMMGIMAQQIPFDAFRDRDGRGRDERFLDGRNRRRRGPHFRTFDLRNITRLLFLRELFDRNHR